MQQTKHINIWYLFITNLNKQILVTMVNFPIKEIVADYFSKPLQGQLFQLHCNTILGIIMADFLKYTPNQKPHMRNNSKYAFNWIWLYHPDT